jgi:hypothetical protein
MSASMNITGMLCKEGCSLACAGILLKAEDYFLLHEVKKCSACGHN